MIIFKGQIFEMKEAGAVPSVIDDRTPGFIPTAAIAALLIYSSFLQLRFSLQTSDSWTQSVDRKRKAILVSLCNTVFFFFC